MPRYSCRVLGTNRIAAADPNVSNGALARLTAVKAINNWMFRWVPFFLPVLQRALGATTGQLTAVMGVGEMAGLTSLAVGRQLDNSRERTAMLVGLSIAIVGSLVAIIGNVQAFAVGYFAILMGISWVTVSGHAYLSRRVRYARRARVIGIFEVSWASALLVGVPLAAVLIGLFGWRGPFVAFAATAVVIGIILALSDDTAELLEDAAAGSARVPFTSLAVLCLAASACIAICGLSMVVIVGTWLDDALSVSTGGVGLVAMAFGAAELVASGGSAAVADRLGPRRSTRAALVIVLVGLGIMTQAGSSLLVASVGLVLFFLGFEFSIVTSFAIVSESLPAARGRVLTTNVAIGTVGRGLGIAASGSLYGLFGIAGPATLSAVGAVAAILFLTLADRRWATTSPAFTNP